MGLLFHPFSLFFSGLLSRVPVHSRKKTGTSEGLETSEQEYIFDEANPILFGLFLFGRYLKVVL